MSIELIFVFSLLVISAGLLASNRVGFDVVALLVIISLVLSGVLTVQESFSGFGNPIVILIAALLVVGDMLDRTGVTRAVGNFIQKRGGKSEAKLLTLIMIMAAVLSSFMSSTAVVAVFIPIVMRIATNTGLNRSRLLMPMAFAAMMSGMLTLIATPPNIVVHEALRGAGHAGLGFFSFAPIGIVVLIVSILYIQFVGKVFLSSDDGTRGDEGTTRSINDVFDGYSAGRSLKVYEVGSESRLVNCRIDSSPFQFHSKAAAVVLQRFGKFGESIFLEGAHDLEIKEKDRIVLLALEEYHGAFLAEKGIHETSLSQKHQEQWLWEMGGAVILIHPESSLIGKSIKDIKFRDRFGVHVLGMRRNDSSIEDFENINLRGSDSLFVGGTWPRVEKLNLRSREFIVLEEPSEKKDVVPAFRKLPISMLILLGLIASSIFNLVPLAVASILAGLAGLFTRCFTVEDAYRAIHWRSIVLIAGMLPLADALEKTGGIQIIANTLLTSLGDAGPGAVYSALFLVTASISLFLSNTASAVLVIPVALKLASLLEISPLPLSMAVLIGASSSFATPVASSVVTLVVEPGRYRFIDFVKVGTPLILLVWLISFFLVPVFFPY